MKLFLIIHKLLILLVMLIAAGCVSKSYLGSSIAPRSIAVVGVAVAPGVKPGKSQTAMALEFQQLIHQNDGYKTLRSSEVSKAMNSVTPGSYNALVDNYSRNGALHPNDLQALVSARLPVQLALIARVEKNEVKPGELKRLQLRNNAGDLLTDRERRVLSTVREMQMQASMINMATGAIVWSRTYRSAPTTESSYIHYSGSSFSGSLAASLANTMTNGLRVPAGPLPPSNQLTLRSLMREVIRNLPQ